MNRDEIMKKMHEIFWDVLDDGSIRLKDETTAEDVEDWDSLNHINLIVAIEKEFGVKFKLDELQDLANVGDMVGLIQAKTGRAA